MFNGKMKSIFSISIAIVLIMVLENVSASEIFDLSLYEEALNAGQCRRHLDYLMDNPHLKNEFLDAGIRTPKGILEGNLVDLGNYEQCLRIKDKMKGSEELIEGKYCTVRVPLYQLRFIMPEIPQTQSAGELSWLNFLWTVGSDTDAAMSFERFNEIRDYNIMRIGIETSLGFIRKGPIASRSTSREPEFNLAVCIPKSCSSRQALDTLLLNFTSTGLDYFEDSCRLPNDKLFVAGDYIALFILSVIGVVTALSTAYDLHRIYYHGEDPKCRQKDILRSFSLYSNARTLVSCTVKNQFLSHIAGFKAMCIIWVIFSHTFLTHFSGVQANPLEMLNWLTSPEAVWITSYHLALDVFLLITGIMAVYNIIPYVSTKKENFRMVPWYFLQRFRRVLPVIAMTVLLQATLLNHIADGPYWDPVAMNTGNCRRNWWITMLQVQNSARPTEMCLSHSWFFAIDNQLYIQSPFIIMGLVEPYRLKFHKIILTINVTLGLIISFIVNFIRNSPSSLFALSRPDDAVYYLENYYISGITRSAPFMVGTLFGYLLLKVQAKSLRVPQVVAAAIWCLATGVSFLLIWINYPIVQIDWNHQVIDNLINIFVRCCWAFCIGWMLFACAIGHGGIVNWFFSHKIWKIPGRLAIAMYLIHYPLLHVLNSTALAPVHFSVGSAFLKFVMVYSLTALAAFVVSLLVERPCSALVKYVEKENCANTTPLECTGSEIKLQEDILCEGASSKPSITLVQAQNTPLNVV